MNRRDTLKALLAAGITGGFGSNLRAMDTAARDSFGGWTGKKFKATGFFRLEKDERWWMVTPEGNAFLSFGINHLHPNLWRLPHNRDAWKETFGIEDIQDASQFNPALRKWFLATCKDFGINTVGVHCDLAVANTPAPAMSYMQPFRTVNIPTGIGLSLTNALLTSSPLSTSNTATSSPERSSCRVATIPICSATA